jgi:hypothetical protein
VSRRPPLAAPRALALAAVVALGCGNAAKETCPGQPIGAFALQAHRVDAATACVAGPADGWASAVPATIPAALAEDPAASFPATLSHDPEQGTAALCTGRSLGAVLFGTRAGDHVHVEASAGSAVLAACAGTCGANLTVIVDGDLVPGTAGAPDAFTGTLVERMDATGGDCGTCVLPCSATYALEGTAR